MDRETLNKANKLQDSLEAYNELANAIIHSGHSNITIFIGDKDEIVFSTPTGARTIKDALLNLCNEQHEAIRKEFNEL